MNMVKNTIALQLGSSLSAPGDCKSVGFLCLKENSEKFEILFESRIDAELFMLCFFSRIKKDQKMSGAIKM